METQESITQWADATFGPVSSNARLAARANEEMAELLRAITSDNSSRAPEETADVVIVLCRLATTLGCKLTFDTAGLDLQSDPHMTDYDWATEANLDLSDLLKMFGCKGTPVGAKNTLIDCVTYLRRLAAKMGFSLQVEIDKKMHKNRHERKWAKDGSGHGYHVKAKE